MSADWKCATHSLVSVPQRESSTVAYRKPLWATACVKIPYVLIEGDMEALKEVLEESLNHYHCSSPTKPPVKCHNAALTHTSEIQQTTNFCVCNCTIILYYFCTGMCSLCTGLPTQMGRGMIRRLKFRFLKSSRA